MMKSLAKEIVLIGKDTKSLIRQRLREFSSFNHKPNSDWFSELCFCILTANSKAKTAIAIQNEIGFNGFSSLSQPNLAKIIRKNKHRFHNNKAKYIVEARKHLDIKNKVLQFNNSAEKREWLVKNIKGLGYKEASHFLRNTGHENLAILDRHIINLMLENDLLKEKPRSLNRKDYLEIEEKLGKLAKKLSLSQSGLDLHMWYLKTGSVLK